MLQNQTLDLTPSGKSKQKIKRYRYNASLPKIKNNTMASKQQSDNQKHMHYSEIDKSQVDMRTKYMWVHQQTNYSNFSQAELEEETKKLRKHLLEINDKVDEHVGKIKTKNNFRVKTLTYHEDKTHNIEVKKHQILNNNAILSLYSKEYATLKSRQQKIQKYGKFKLDQSIQEVRQLLESTKLKNKSLKEKNRTLGDSILQTDNLFQQMARLQNQKELGLIRRAKLQKKFKQSESLMRDNFQKMNNISGQYETAQKYLYKFKNKTVTEQQNRKNIEKLTHKEHVYELNKKKAQYMRLNKQQNYHSLLKLLQGCVQKIRHTEEEIGQKDLELVSTRRTLQTYESQLQKLRIKNIKQKDNSRSINNEEEEPFELKSSISSIHEKIEQNEESKKEEKILIDQNF